MDVAWVASEMAPFSKTGGLGDVAGALPIALAARGHRVMGVSPAYKAIDGAQDTGVRAWFHLYGQGHEVRYLALDRDGVRWVFVDHPSFRRAGIYGDAEGAYGDNLFRYALFSRAAIEAPRRLGLGDRLIYHVNDWHTGLLPVYLDHHYRANGLLRRAGVVLGLHNLGHQGTTDGAHFAALDLPGWAWPTVDMYGRLNPLKAGIVSADALVAVSPTYARQIQHDHGFGLEPVLRMRTERLVGIVNGIGPEWDPATDRHLPARYDAGDLSGKAVCKQALQQELGLPVRDVPLLGLVSRLDPQKGVDLVEAIAPWLLSMDVQLVMLGSGAAELEGFFRRAEHTWPDKVRGWVGYNERLAHLIEAGSDLFLMPSRFEPCGLNQLYSMRYGTPPVVHATGGLADTVSTFDPSRGHGTGWAFRPNTPSAFAEAVGWALLTLTRYPAAWRRVQQNGMRQDLSWDRSASLYEQVYDRVLGWR